MSPVSDKSSAEIIHDQDAADAETEAPAPKAPAVPEPITGTHNDIKVEITPNSTTGSGYLPPGEIGAMSGKKTSASSGSTGASTGAGPGAGHGFPTELGFI